ncbi:uncharacterized protein PAC_17320 [Phialocephala subalpina]|uniref:Heterokaryon incompatibility domain-containing protein n=1 Tax=Phialocephala subalpina TaxID=576137 RepID=A0A1L7XQT9_9HELO|nr:uncharacterized protein PAC_17320 [Phialocephala subalpina]
MATTTGLCSKCQRIFVLEKSDEHKNKRIPHHENIQNMIQASKNGCIICGILWSKFSAQDKEFLIGNGLEEFTVSFYVTPMHRKIQLSFYTGDVETQILFFEFEDLEGVAVNKEMARASEAIRICYSDTPCSKETTSTGSIASLQRAKTWIDQCIQEHQICQHEEQTKRAFPTRLVRLDTTEDLKLYLCDAQDLPESTQYMTLSHRWGTGKLNTLTLQNIEDLRACIPFTDLTKTFQDAIIITRFMGIEYIWIDSLCIIQDSAEDWERESLLMRDVYTNSYCNIAATHAMDGQKGCFVDRRDIDISSPIIEIPRALLPNDALFKSGRYKCKDRDLWDNEVTTSPLLKRAWVFQERLLAPRILHFASSRIFFECQEARTCEGFSEERIPERYFTDEVKTKLQRSLAKAYSICGDDAESVERRRVLGRAAWKIMVDNFSTCELTRESDRLVAISGLASHLQPLMSCRYIAGLWGVDFVHQLLWKTYEHCASSGSYQAPSWSWASEPRVVSLRGYNLHSLHSSEQDLEKSQMTELVTVEKVEVVTVDGNPMSQVIYSKALSGYRASSKIRGVDFWFHPDNDPRGEDVVQASTFMCVILVRVKESNDSPDGVEGLILRATGKAKGQYERIALVQSSSRDRGVVRMYPGYVKDQKEKDMMTEDLYEEYNQETDSYTFTIV